MKYFTIIFLFLVLPFNFYSQSSFSQFKKLSRPEKAWTFFHPFVAKKAFRITKQVLADVDSVKKTRIIGTDNNGGKLDAFKHTYWMALLSAKIGPRKALKLGKAHERGNYLQYKKHLLEDSILPDSTSSLMDMKNNSIGANWGTNFKKISSSEMRKIIIDSIDKLSVIKKDEKGDFLTCDGVVIPMKDWAGKWNIPKCLEGSFKH